MIETIKNPKKKYWYKFYVGECPVCGRDQGYKIRVNGEKPKSIEERYVQLGYQETYDYCERID